LWLSLSNARLQTALGYMAVGMGIFVPIPTGSILPFNQIRKPSGTMSNPNPTPDGDYNEFGRSVLPDPKKCKTEVVGKVKSFARCLVDCATGCPYVVYFAGGQFCKHPHWRQFLKP
jgi:hypothetical protein